MYADDDNDADNNDASMITINVNEFEDEHNDAWTMLLTMMDNIK